MWTFLHNFVWTILLSISQQWNIASFVLWLENSCKSQNPASILALILINTILNRTSSVSIILWWSLTGHKKRKIQLSVTEPSYRNTPHRPHLMARDTTDQAQHTLLQYITYILSKKWNFHPNWENFTVGTWLSKRDPSIELLLNFGPIWLMW